MGRTREVSKILTSDTALATGVELAAVQNSLGLVSITPSSVAATGGSATISSSGAVSFTSASAISINDVFSATFDNYRLVLVVSNSASVVNRIRLRKAGVNSTTNYTRMTLVGNTAGASSPSTTSDPDVTFGGDVKKVAVIDIFRPFLNESSIYLSSTFTTVFNCGFIAVNHTTVDTFDGFNLFPASGNMTGTISIYGYKI